MRKGIIAAAVAVAAASTTLAGATPASATGCCPPPICTWTSYGNPLYIRSGPGTNYSVIGSDGFHSNVYTVGYAYPSGFYQLAYRSGYVNGAYLGNKRDC